MKLRRTASVRSGVARALGWVVARARSALPLTGVLLAGCGDSSEEVARAAWLDGGREAVKRDAAPSPDVSDAGATPPRTSSPVALLARVVQPAGFAMTLEATAPEENTLTEQRAQLGRRLFYDPILSRDRTVSCGSCHQQQYGFSEPRAVAEGVEQRLGQRNTPQLANLAWVRTGLFWDGRTATLEEQVTQPIENPLEMDLEVADAVQRLSAEPSYVAAFEAAYAGPPSATVMAAALASFVRVLVSANSPYDRYLAGDESALSGSARRGVRLFLDGKTGCFHCHSEATLTNDGFFNNGTYKEGGDAGRQALTGRTGDLGKFRVPSLRNVAVSGPYMHDGSLATLADVIEHYARGGNGHPSTDVQIEELELDEQDKQDLLAFLTSLTDEEFLGAEALSAPRQPE